MSGKFLNDHKVGKVLISKVLSITAGGFHCWCDSNVGRIRKPNNAISDFLWDIFSGREAKQKTIAKKEMTYKLKDEKPKWYKRILRWVKSLFKKHK